MNARAESPSMWSSRLVWLAIAMVILKLWLVLGQPVVAIGGAGHDDRHYLELANNILGGKWLGDYNQLTLAKGPMYSLWITGVFLLGIPLPLSLHLLYLAACLAAVAATRAWMRRAWLPPVVFIILWLNPMTYEMPVLGRVLRQNFYTPAALLFFAGLIALYTYRKCSPMVRLGWGALAGLSGASLWLTREESIWVAPSMILLILSAVIGSRKVRCELKHLLLSIGGGALVAALVIATVCTINLRSYGWFGSVEFRAPQFIQAYGSLQRVQSDYVVPYVPVTREARDALYRVSPAFAELRPYLEGDGGRGWAAASSPFTGKPAEELEIAGGWFMWALRDAVAAAGHGHNAKEALAFYQLIADQVNSACDQKLLPAGPRHDSLIPIWRKEHTLRLKKSMLSYIGYFAFWDGFDPYPAASSGSAPVLQLFRDLTRWNLSASNEAQELRLPKQEKYDSWKFGALKLTGNTMRWLNIALVLTALPGTLLLAWIALRKKADPYALYASLSLLGGTLAVVLINLLVDVMSFPNRSPGAFAQAYPLVLLFACVVWSRLLSPQSPSAAEGTANT